MPVGTNVASTTVSVIATFPAIPRASLVRGITFTTTAPAVMASPAPTPLIAVKSLAATWAFV